MSRDFPYNRKSNRLGGYNYSKSGIYFITICTYNQEKWFGEIFNGKVVLNEYGKIAEKIWEAIPENYVGIDVDEYIIMPNHLHGIVIISPGHKAYVGTGQCPVPTNNKDYGLLSKIINSYKGLVTKEIRQYLKRNTFMWQRSYYDRIIRNQKELELIRKYIKFNPSNWNKDN